MEHNHNPQLPLPRTQQPKNPIPHLSKNQSEEPVIKPTPPKTQNKNSESSQKGDSSQSQHDHARTG